MKPLIKFIILLAGSLFLASCGSSSGGGSASVPVVTPPPAPAPAPKVNYDTTEYRHSYGLAQINALAAYDKGATGAGVTVAVIDTGINISDPQIKANIQADSTNIVTSNKADLNDTDGHGTGVAGVIAAIRDPSNTSRNNMQGVAFNAKIMALNASSTGSCAKTAGCQFFDRNIAAALDYARVRGVKIVNISLGGSGFNTPTLIAAYKRAVAAGMIIIQAAGNREKGQTDLQIAQPEGSASAAWASWANGQIIVAGAVDKSSVIGTFSRRAGNVAKNVFLVAAGDKVLSLGVTKAGDAAYFTWTGTSFSTPHIAGAAALLLGAFPNLTGKQIADLLLSTATDLGAPGADVIYGRGLVNLKAAFAPKGTTSIAVTTATGETTRVDLKGSVILGGKAFGGFAGLATAVGNSLMLDSYNRSYRVNLGRQIFNPPATVNLDSMISSTSNHTTSLRLDRSTNLQLSWTEDRQFETIDQQYFFNHGNHRARYSHLRMKLNLSVGTGQKMIFAEGLSLKEAMEDYNQNEFLTIGRGDFMALLGQGNNQSIIFNQKLGPRTGVSVAVAHSSQTWQQYRLKADSFIMMTRLDHGLSPSVRVGVDFGVMTEKGSVLGSLSNGALSLGRGATTAFAAARVNWDIARTISFFTKATYGRTAVAAANSSLVRQINGLTATSFSAGLIGNSLFQRGDRLSFAISQPLRVIGGRADISYVTTRNYQTNSLSFISNQIDLAPGGREIDIELAYTMANIFGARVDVNILHQITPNHRRSNPDNTAVLIRLGSEF